MSTAITCGSTSGWRIRPGRWSSSCTPIPLPGRLRCAGGRDAAWGRNGHPGPAAARGALHLGGYLGRLHRGSQAKGRPGRTHQCRVPAGGHLCLALRGRAFGHVFVCFVLEHLTRPAEALAILRRVVRPGGTITVIEGDHGSTCFYPDSPAAHAAIQCQVRMQREVGGNACRRPPRSTRCWSRRASMRSGYFPRRTAGTRKCQAAGPRSDGFTRKTFTVMIEGIREPVLLRRGLSSRRASMQVAHPPNDRGGRRVLLYVLQGRSGEKGSKCTD